MIEFDEREIPEVEEDVTEADLLPGEEQIAERFPFEDQ